MNGETRLKVEKLTIGDLVVAVTDAALEVTEDEDKACEIAGLALAKLLAASAPETADYLLLACGNVSIH
jgi:hypothetical protein